MAPVNHVIIGSGINALVAAALLSAKGHRVTLLEREDRLGGCLRTDEITLPGFHHDVMATTFVLFLTSPAYAELGAALGRHGLEFCHTTLPTAVLRPDGTSLVLSGDMDKNTAAFEACAQGDGAALAATTEEIGADADFLFALLGAPLWSWKMARLLMGQWRKKGLLELKAWFGESMRPARAWLEADFTSPLAQALLAPWPLHAGLTPETAYSGQMAKVIAFALQAAGAPIVKGGAAQAVAAFRALIEEQGGEIQTGADVTRINVTGQKVTGVTLADGRVVAADRVIASVAPGRLYQQLLSAAPLPEQRDAARHRPGRGNFQLHYALNGAPDWVAEGLEDVALIHLADGIDSVSKSANEATRGLLPETPTICVGQPTRLDPSRCPEGKEILWLQIPDAPGVIKGDAAGEIETTGSWDEPTREAFADRIEAILRRHIRNFDEIKLARTACSPADLEAMNINLVNGDPYGGDCAIDQFFVWRPFASTRNAATQISGLYHIGASTHPGPGLGGGSGYNLAKSLGA